MPTFAKVITFLVFLQPATCDESATSCKHDREETSLIQTKVVVQQGTPAHHGKVEQGKGKGKNDREACSVQGAFDSGRDNLCLCALGDDCEGACMWSLPGDDALAQKVSTPTGEAATTSLTDSTMKLDPDWGQWFFDSKKCPKCKCYDQYKEERAQKGSAPLEAQMASLANLVYQDVGCPASGHADRSALWTTESGWEVASSTNKATAPVCKNTRNKDDVYWKKNMTEFNPTAHDNFVLFINKKGNAPNGIKANTCVLAIEGTTFNGIKNWWNDAARSSSPWCGMNVQSGFKHEIMQFLGNWGIEQNAPLVGKPKGSTHYTQANYDTDKNNKHETIIDDFTQVVQNQCSNLWVTGHSLGGAMAELFAMCWNKQTTDPKIAKVSKVYTFGAPSAFDPILIPASPTLSRGSDKAVKTTWTTCFGGKRFYNMDDGKNGLFDPVPSFATKWMHLPYAAVQLAQKAAHTTECAINADDTPVCHLPSARGGVGGLSGMKVLHMAIGAAAAVVVTAAIVGTAGIAAPIAVTVMGAFGAAGAGRLGYLVKGADLHSMKIYEQRLA